MAQEREAEKERQQQQRVTQVREAEKERQAEKQRVAQERDAEKERQQQRVTQARESEKERQAEKLRAVQEREAEKERQQQQRVTQAREAEKERQAEKLRVALERDAEKDGQLAIQRQQLQQQSLGRSQQQQQQQAQQQQQQNSLARSGLPPGVVGSIADPNRVGIQPSGGLAARPQLYTPPPTTGRPQVGYGDNAYRPSGTPPRDTSNDSTQSAASRLMPQALPSGQASVDANKQAGKAFAGYQTPVVTMSPSQPTCPPGSSPARHANGTYVAIPPASICIKNEQHTPGLDDLRNRNGENNPAAAQRVGQGAASSGANPAFADPDLYCNQPAQLRNGSIACVEPKCPPGQIKSKGRCVTPTIVCPSPNMLDGNRCVAPPVANNDPIASTNAAGGSGGRAGSAGGGTTGTQPGSTKRNPGKDAAGCVSDNNGILTNNCGAKIFILYCGDLMYSKKTCGSGSKGQFFTHSNNLDSGAKETIRQKSGGQYRWAACFGGISFGNDGEYVDTPQGGYTCLER
ncbi:hypothetical protein [Polaromonas sp. SM01]|uniref:hypothetical protein n=1 Tax=Polaromonas sp. SM01 TaxID=3085630 RepID=UPI002981829F|nr:hypothetical protein [Polaromonas sp. SM01]MDW5442606.1 hypothetical protein [Polaromonas sp. SM01]